MARVLVIGLNPAWQMVAHLPRLEVGEVNRALAAYEIASGKGLNAARTLAALGHQVDLLQILGGERGRKCLAACEGYGIRSLHIWVDADTRYAMTLLDAEKHSATEIIAPFAVPIRTTEAAVREELEATLKAAGETYDGVCICGTVPAGCPTDIYGDLLAEVTAPVTVVDAWKEVTPEVLGQTGFLKVNSREYEILRSKWGRYLAPEGKGPVCLITDGAAPARLLEPGRPVRLLKLPELAGTLNPIGAGDVVAGAFTHHRLAGMEVSAAFLEALALGMASCLTLLPADIDEKAAKSLAEKLRAGPGWEDELV